MRTMHPYVMQTLTRQRERELRKPAGPYGPLGPRGRRRRPAGRRQNRGRVQSARTQAPRSSVWLLPDGAGGSGVRSGSAGDRFGGLDLGEGEDQQRREHEGGDLPEQERVLETAGEIVLAGKRNGVPCDRVGDSLFHGCGGWRGGGLPLDALAACRHGRGVVLAGAVMEADAEPG